MIVSEKRREQKREANRRWRQRHPDAVKRKNDDYRRKNSERLNAYWKAWKRAHKDSVRQTTRKRYAQNRTVRLKQIAIYKSENRTSVKLRSKRYDAQPHRRLVRRDSTRRWRLANPEKLRAQAIRRRARRRGGVIDGDPRSVNRVVAQCQRCKTFVCYYCGFQFKRKDLHIDHIVPLSKGGEHSVKNICRSCSDCNLKKRDTAVSDLEFLAQKLLPL